MFEKILIANRGEIAVRIIRAAHELGIATVAVYSEADRDALHVQLADEAVCIGPAPAPESYLNVPNVISAALITGAEAVHPGYGFLSENATFADALGEVGLKFIGPPPEVIERMGDKAEARNSAKKAGVPLIPGSEGVVRNEREARKLAEELGYPVMVKAVAGGGGRGIRVVNSPEELAPVLDLARAEAKAAFSNDGLYLEKVIVNPRHVEVQILADEHGKVVHLGERDCSVQTPRHQKMVEESPSPGLKPQLRKQLGKAAVKAAQAIGYHNAGTVEFLVDEAGKFYFMEMNTRLQVEHPVTEAVTGLDLVKQQLLIAGGEPLGFEQADIKLTGHALECRLAAEDPFNGFKPSPGTLTKVRWPGGMGVRVDTYAAPGVEISPYYDPMFAKIIVWGADRQEALKRMRRCLEETMLEGIQTSLPFQKEIIGHEIFQAGQATTSFLGEHLLSGEQ